MMISANSGSSGDDSLNDPEWLAFCGKWSGLSHHVTQVVTNTLSKEGALAEIKSLASKLADFEAYLDRRPTLLKAASSQPTFDPFLRYQHRLPLVRDWIATAAIDHRKGTSIDKDLKVLVQTWSGYANGARGPHGTSIDRYIAGDRLAAFTVGIPVVNEESREVALATLTLSAFEQGAADVIEHPDRGLACRTDPDFHTSMKGALSDLHRGSIVWSLSMENGYVGGQSAGGQVTFSCRQWLMRRHPDGDVLVLVGVNGAGTPVAVAGLKDKIEGFQGQRGPVRELVFYRPEPPMNSSKETDLKFARTLKGCRKTEVWSNAGRLQHAQSGFASPVRPALPWVLGLILFFGVLYADHFTRFLDPIRHRFVRDTATRTVPMSPPVQTRPPVAAAPDEPVSTPSPQPKAVAQSAPPAAKRRRTTRIDDKSSGVPSAAPPKCSGVKITQPVTGECVESSKAAHPGIDVSGTVLPPGCVGAVSVGAATRGATPSSAGWQNRAPDADSWSAKVMLGQAADNAFQDFDIVACPNEHHEHCVTHTVKVGKRLRDLCKYQKGRLSDDCRKQLANYCPAEKVCGGTDPFSPGADLRLEGAIDAHGLELICHQ